MENICIKRNPYNKCFKDLKTKKVWKHPDAKEIREYDLDYSTWVVYECPNCNLIFTVEMPN